MKIGRFTELLRNSLQELILGRRFARHVRKSILPGLPRPAFGEKGSAAKILVETGDWMFPNHIGLAIFLSAYSKNANVVSVGFSVPNLCAGGNSRLLGLRALVQWLLARSHVRKSLGLRDVLHPTFTDQLKKEAETRTDALRRNIKDRASLFALSVDGVWIGDLVYDDYLATHQRATVDLEDDHLWQHVEYYITWFLVFKYYFFENSVRAVVVSHTTYRNALPARIGVHAGVDVFQVNLQSVYRLSQERIYAHLEFLDYPSMFRELPSAEQEAAIPAAQLALESLINGEWTDELFSTKSVFDPGANQLQISNTENLKILVAAHCFYDSPHFVGPTLFTDFLEWMEFLAEIAERHNYEWFIKPHPMCFGGNVTILEEFVRRHPTFCLLSADTSHGQLVEAGINVCLTVHGTVARELPLLGVPVINASRVNPHVAYAFSASPSSVQEYVHILDNLPSWVESWNVNRSEIYEYYYMARLHERESWVVDDFRAFLAACGGYDRHFSYRTYDAWLTTCRRETIRRAKKEVAAFLATGDYKLVVKRGDLLNGPL